ncbi:MAG: capsular polysaccharide biosynthesis protein, partial [Rhizobium sp.]
MDSTIFPLETRSSVTVGGEGPSWLPPANARLLAFLPTRQRFPLVGPAFSASLKPIELMMGAADGVVGSGDGPLARLARFYARIKHLPFWTVGSGFLQPSGPISAAPVSFIADDLGIHSSALLPSRLEALLQHTLSAADMQRAANLREW